MNVTLGSHEVVLGFLRGQAAGPKNSRFGANTHCTSHGPAYLVRWSVA